MLGELLALESRWLDPDSRYFLIRFAQTYGSLPTSAGVPELAERFGLSGPKVSAALKQLHENGVLLRSQEQGARGRPRHLHSINGEWLRSLPASQPPIHESAIAHLLEHERSAARKAPTEEMDRFSQLRARKTADRVSVVNRLLMAVLLSRADALGVVRNVGREELGRLVGVSSEQVKRRVQRLLKHELVRAYVPGATGSVLFKKLKGAYFLNLNHRELGGVVNAPVILVSVDRRCNEPRWYDIADELLEPVDSGKEQIALCVRVFFRAKHEKRNLGYLLRSRLDLYAGMLLSSNGEPRKKVEAAVSSQIVKDILVERRVAKPGPTSERYALLVEYLLGKAVELEQSIRHEWMADGRSVFPQVDIDSTDFALLPSKKVRGESGDYFYMSRSVLALPKGASGLTGTVVIVERKGKHPTQVTTYKNEDLMAFEDRRDFCLLSVADD